MNNRPLVIYHDNCADGFFAAFAAWLSLGDEVDYMPANYKDEPFTEYLIDLVDGRDVYVLDFSYPKPLMELILAYASNLVWLDHHKSAFESWCGRYEKGMVYLATEGDRGTPMHIHLDDNQSGALLAWRYFHPRTTVPKLIEHVDDYDRWVFKMADTRAINASVWSYAPWSFSQCRTWITDWSLMHGDGMLTEGLALLRAQDRQVNSIVDHCARPVRVVPAILRGLDPWTPPWTFGADDTVGALGLAANCAPDMANEVGAQLAKMSGTFGLTWNQGKGDKIKCSIRSSGEYDVSKIAAAFGGGGHRNAAGFTTTMDRLQSWLINDEGENE